MIGLRSDNNYPFFSKKMRSPHLEMCIIVSSYIALSKEELLVCDPIVGSEGVRKVVKELEA